MPKATVRRFFYMAAAIVYLVLAIALSVYIASGQMQM